ncbi:sulfurtransferase [Carboxylicivirga mesophila]|uniref:Sulfurtransferase n=1 Tax=Carboxylicivirga mesophila TaxID=1166478 RepID=A0ABS5K4C3_9BACT|nr:rhodanese-like domain-containing protein [Carboxylicivirga mesophila]MBS2209879.1 sulfurtransferase [Carboxylicivirga mesophila]
MKRLSLVAALVIYTIGAVAQGDFISVKELAGKINDSKVQIFDARKEAEYKQVHIRNAVSFPVEELSTKTPIEGILKSDAEIAKVMGAHGVDFSKEIVLYCNKGSNAGRMYWIMKMMGASNVKLLDGNLDAWKAARKPVTRMPKMPKKTTVTANVDRSTYLTMDDVKAQKAKSNVILVDARADNYFNGTDPKSKGHIEGAISINSDLMRDDKGLIKSAEDLNKLFASKGVTKDKEVILYCQTSTRAGLLYTIMTTKLGYTNVKVYDGAYNEWVTANKVVS